MCGPLASKLQRLATSHWPLSSCLYTACLCAWHDSLSCSCALHDSISYLTRQALSYFSFVTHHMTVVERWRTPSLHICFTSMRSSPPKHLVQMVQENYSRTARSALMAVSIARISSQLVAMEFLRYPLAWIWSLLFLRKIAVSSFVSWMRTICVMKNLSTNANINAFCLTIWLSTNGSIMIWRGSPLTCIHVIHSYVHIHVFTDTCWRQDYVNALALEYKSENPKKKAIRLIRNISRLGHQVSGWEYRVATAATFTTAYAAQVSSVSNPWVVTLGSTVLFGQMTVLYAVCDVIFTVVDVTHDYIQVSRTKSNGGKPWHIDLAWNCADAWE